MILKVVKFLFYLYFVIYALVHVLVMFYPAIVGHLIFMNSVRWPFGGDLSKPTEYGLDKVHNFYITNKKDNLKLGVWHFIPEFFKYDAKTDAARSVDSHLERYLRKEDDIPVIIYAHGNDRDRGASFRIVLCNNLVNMGYHVFAIDYRGYGDSEGWPSEEGTASDVIELFNLLREKKPNAKIYLYGHSLGTGIVSHAARKLSESNVNIDGVILEAPFVNASKGAQDYHLSLAFNNNKLIRKKIDESLTNLNIRFNTDKNIVKIKSRILICHAEDDWFIPQSHSAILYDISQTQRPKDYPRVKYMNVGKEHGLGHFIHTHQAHFDEIRNMIEGKW